jgi:hypothetical protein
MKGQRNTASFIASESGHTVVEVIIAIAVLTAALVPVSHFMSKVFLSSTTRDLIVAANLARAEMEAAANSTVHLSEERTVKIGNRTWRVERKLREISGLLTIEVAVYGKDRTSPVVAFSTLRKL